jgi:hypothetical protein
MRSECMLTEVDRDLICTLLHYRPIVTPIQLGERRQASRTHPVMEVFVCLEIRYVRLVVAVREPLTPVWRRNNLTQICVPWRARVFASLAGPCDVF